MSLTPKWSPSQICRCQSAFTTAFAAVVADSVRSLAQRSAVAAKDISQIIQDSIQKITKVSSINAQIAGASEDLSNASLVMQQQSQQMESLVLNFEKKALGDEHAA